MKMAKRIFLFLLINFLVMMTLSLVLRIFHVQPYLKSYGLDLQSLFIFCLIWGMGGALISLALSRQMAKWLMGVHLISPQTHNLTERSLIEMVHRLSKAAGLRHLPEVGIFESKEPNAFATGPSEKRSLVAVSSGLLQRMSEGELEGVIGHEISHIKNGDMVTMTLLQGVVNAFVMFLARILAYTLAGLGKRSENSSSQGGSYMAYHLFVFLFEVVFMILGSLVIAAFSRFREFRADRGGARLASKGNMIAALQSLERMQLIHDEKVDQPAFAAFKISTPKKQRTWMQFFSTHPPLKKRIERLQML